MTTRHRVSCSGLVLAMGIGVLGRLGTSEHFVRPDGGAPPGHLVIVAADSTLTLPEREPVVAILVEASATFDPRARVYEYAYILTSERSNRGDVSAFALTPVPAPLRVSSPPHWDSWRYASSDSDSAIVWAVVDAGPLPTGFVDTGNVPPSAYDIEPGHTLAGFRFVSERPSRVDGVTFHAQPFDTIAGGPEPVIEDPGPTLFDRGASGTVLGPGSPTVGEHSRAEARAGLVLPRPTETVATVTYSIDRPARVQVSVFRERGPLVRVLSVRNQEPGTHSIGWTGRDESGRFVAPGVYTLRLGVLGTSYEWTHSIVVRR